MRPLKPAILHKKLPAFYSMEFFKEAIVMKVFLRANEFFDISALFKRYFAVYGCDK